MKRWIGAFLIAIMVLTGAGCLLAEAPGQHFVYAEDAVEIDDGNSEGDRSKDDDGKRLVITVIEDRSAVLLGDGDVPLAAGPGSGAECVTEVLLALVLLVLSASYAVYFRRKRNRLFELKRRAATLEQQLLEGGPHER